VTWIAADLAEEFPELRLHERTVDGRSGPSPPELRERLQVLSNRFRGPEAVELRRRPVPWAYRVFFRHIGLDPDEDRTPVEALALERLKHGGFRSRSLLDDAITIAVMETGVPVWALDAERVEGELGLRPAERGERLGEGDYAPDLPAGRLLLVDDAGPIGVLFGRMAPERAVGPETERITLFSVQVTGVPDLHVDEAFWTVEDIIGEP
jgi:DNA/RNA-binding domain of Phe-tRNA-synthetase-like protein